MMKDECIQKLSIIPGRLRLKIKNIFKNEAYKEKLIKLKEDKNIYDVKVNIYTSKILIFYNHEKFSVNQILKKIQSLDMTDNEDNNLLSVIKNKENQIHHELEEGNKYEYSALLYLIALYCLIRGDVNLSIGIVLLDILLRLIKHIYNNLRRRIIYNYLKEETIKDIRLKKINYFKKDINVSKINFDEKQKKVEPVYTSFINDIKLNDIKEIDENKKIFKFYQYIFPSMLAVSLILFYISGNILIPISILILNNLNVFSDSLSFPILMVIYSGIKEKFLIKDTKAIKNLSDLDTIVFDINKSNMNINLELVERLRECGVWDVRILSSASKIRTQNLAYKSGIENCKWELSETEKIREIKKIKNEEKVVAVILNENELNYNSDINIKVKNDLSELNYNFEGIIVYTKDLTVIPNAVERSKYALEKAYQNQIISIGAYIIGIALSLGEVINPIGTSIIVLFNRLYVYINSLKPIKYQALYE